MKCNGMSNAINLSLGICPTVNQGSYPGKEETGVKCL